jgi:hypothetical protein
MVVGSRRSRFTVIDRGDAIAVMVGFATVIEIYNAPSIIASAISSVLRQLENGRPEQPKERLIDPRQCCPLRLGFSRPTAGE